MSATKDLLFEIEEEEARKERERLMADPEFLNSGFDDLESWLGYQRALERDCVPEKAIEERKLKMSLSNERAVPSFSNVVFNAVAAPLFAKGLTKKEVDKTAPPEVKAIASVLEQSGELFAFTFKGRTYSNLTPDSKPKGTPRPKKNVFPHEKYRATIKAAKVGTILEFQHATATACELQHRLTEILTQEMGPARNGGWTTTKSGNSVLVEIKAAPSYMALHSLVKAKK
jgi:hypothetical protein